MFVAALLRCPPKYVESQVWIGLSFEGFVDVGGSKSGSEILDPCFELFLQRGPGSRIVNRIRVLGKGRIWG